MAESEPKPLDRAKESIQSAVAIMCDYLKVGAEIHRADRLAPAVDAIRLLTNSLDCIDALRDGIGRQALHVGGIPAD